MRRQPKKLARLFMLTAAAAFSVDGASSDYPSRPIRMLVFASITSGLPLARAGKVRALAVTSLKRSNAAPEVPAVAETLPGFEVIGWYGVVAPKGTPATIVNRLSAAITKALRASDLKQRLAADGSEAVGSTPAEFDRHIRSELARFARVIRDTEIRRE